MVPVGDPVEVALQTGKESSSPKPCRGEQQERRKWLRRLPVAGGPQLRQRQSKGQVQSTRQAEAEIHSRQWEDKRSDPGPQPCGRPEQGCQPEQ